MHITVDKETHKILALEEDQRQLISPSARESAMGEGEKKKSLINSGTQSVSSTGTGNVNVQQRGFFKDLLNAYNLGNDQIIQYVEERVSLSKETKTIQENN